MAETNNGICSQASRADPGGSDGEVQDRLLLSPACDECSDKTSCDPSDVTMVM